MTSAENVEGAGSSPEEPAPLVCNRCNERPRAKKHAWCVECSRAYQREYNAKNRPKVRKEIRTCSASGCEETFEWSSAHPRQEFHTRSCYMETRGLDAIAQSNKRASGDPEKAKVRRGADQARRDVARLERQEELGPCKRCPGLRDRKNSDICPACRDADVELYESRGRRTAVLEHRVCSLDGCEASYQWSSLVPNMEYCSKSHYMKVISRGIRSRQDSGPKWCNGHEAFHDVTEFSPSQLLQSSARCREYMKLYYSDPTSEERAKKSAASRRSKATKLLKLYGAYIYDIDQIVADQGGVCYLCEGLPGVKGFSIDHDHEMEKLGLPSYRGLACGLCNMGIGAFGDDVEKMLRVALKLDEVRAKLRLALGETPV